MRFPVWLICLLFFAWLLWSTRYIYCNLCGCCGTTTAVPAAVTAASTLTGEPLFKFNDNSAVTNDLFGGWKSKFLSTGGQGDTLILTGYYRKDEVNKSSFANLGFARANAMKALFSPPIPENRIRYASQMVSDDMNKTDLHTSAGYTWSKMVLAQNSGAIIEDGNSTTILFPFKSTAKDRDANVDAYLSSLCAKHKASNSTFSIVGHTDNVGEEEPNRKLGLGRAVSIGSILSKCGVAATRITTDSKGELVPVADNTTDNGRHLNRRVVITVNP